jgi:hypothetical protein
MPQGSFAQSLPRRGRGVIVLLLALATIVPAFALPQYLRAKKSAQWPTTSGEITYSRVRYVRGRRFDGYLGDVQYRYRVGDAEHLSSRVSFARGHLAAAEAWQRALAPYPVGQKVTVYYDPQNPASAVLEPGLAGEMAILYKMDLFFIGVFAAAFLIALYKFREPGLP